MTTQPVLWRYVCAQCGNVTNSPYWESFDANAISVCSSDCGKDFVVRIALAYEAQSSADSIELRVYLRRNMFSEWGVGVDYLKTCADDLSERLESCAVS